MGYRRFELSVILQVALMLAVCVAIAYSIAAARYYATALLLIIVLAVQAAVLLHYIRWTHRELSRFLLAVQHQDLSQSFSMAHASGSFAELSAAFEGVLQRLRETRTATEQQASYLHTIVQHVPVAVMTVEDTGRVDLFNSAARRLLGVSTPRNLQDFAGFGTDFPAKILSLRTGERRLIKVPTDRGLLQLNAMCTELCIGGRNYKIVSLQDIHGELEAREIEAWQNLIRVLTHEIMNTVTPISSLAATASELLADAREAPSHSAIHDVEDAVRTIAQRSAGLMHFVESYRRLSRVPRPAARSIQAIELFTRIHQLMAPELTRRGIEFTHTVEPESLQISADPDLIEQVLINLVRNAIDAVADVAQPRIRVTAELDDSGRPQIAIGDNGHGMDEHVRENIFVPFFTTKRHGSGVGLSLVRQIMRSHAGNVGVRSAPGAGTEVRLSF